MKKFALWPILLLLPCIGYSYPHYIGKGYHQCMTCHSNPFGNGPLNDYGRGVAATALTDTVFNNKKTTNEQLSHRSGFFFNSAKSKFFRPSIDTRVGNLNTAIESEEPDQKIIIMQADINFTFQFGVNQKYFSSHTLSYVPADSATRGNLYKENAQAGEAYTHLRENYLGARVTQNLGLYLGKMDKVFGIRVPDHNAVNKNLTGIPSQHDATYGAMVHYGRELFDLGFQYYLGDYEKVEEFRSSGFSGKAEYSVTRDVRLGFSYLNETYEKASGKPQHDAMAGIFKMGIGKGSSLLWEYGQKSKITNNLKVSSNYFFMQNHIYLRKGLYYITTFQQANPDTSSTTNFYSFSPGIIYMPMQRVELRFDLTDTKTYSTTGVTKDT
jgi:hypothetical protein